MGKKRKLASQSKGTRPQLHSKRPSKPAPARTTSVPSPGAATTPQQASSSAQQPPILPFFPDHSILLIGEGDLSFAASLLSHHACTHVTATVLEPNRAALLAKYPHAATHLTTIESSPGARVHFGIDATRMAPFTRKTPSGGRTGAMDRILFNFPHVGGKSTDVNRQVRHNQQLLAAFFTRVPASLGPGGAVVVTLFDGEPYCLWNVRDLARHAGLAVQRSFAFDAAAYPGYAHARTLGVVRSRRGEPGGGWRGEERAARSYVFVRKEDAVAPPGPGEGRKRKRAAGAESEEDNEEDDGE